LGAGLEGEGGKFGMLGSELSRVWIRNSQTRVTQVWTKTSLKKGGVGVGRGVMGRSGGGAPLRVGERCVGKCAP